MYNYENIDNAWNDNQNRNHGIYARTIYGQSISDNPVPTDTALREQRPFVAIEDVKTKKIMGISKDTLSLGLKIIGPPGSGKTNVMNMLEHQILNTMETDAVNIVFDTKGDYLKEHIHKIPKEHTYVIGSGEEYMGITRYWNIFAEIMPKGSDGRLVYVTDSDTDALEIASMLFKNMQSEHQPIFPAMSEQIVSAVIIYFMRKYWRTNQAMLNNQALLDFFLSATVDNLKNIFMEAGMEDQRSCINYISGTKGNQTQGVLSYINSVMRKMFIGAFAKTDLKREFSMRDMMTGSHKAVIFIEYDLKRGNILAPIYGILLDQALKYALGGRSDKRKNLYLLIDEWALLPKLEHMSNSLSFGRSQGVKLICGLQNYSAIEEIYGEAGTKNIMAGFQSIICFGLTDYASRQYIVNRLGENYQNISFSAQNNSVNVQRAGHSIEDWDIMNLKKGQAAVLLANENPFLFTFPKYNI